MSNLKRTWPLEAFDAINIKAGECILNLQGTDDNLVTLEGDINEKRWQSFRLDEVGKWLKIFIPHDNNSKLTLKLPAGKTWVTEIFAGKAEVEARYLCSRLQIMVGKGDIQISEHTGSLTIASGHTDLRLKHFVQVDVPEPPAMPQPEPPSEPENRTSWDWLHWDDTEWQRWGEGLGEKIGWWALDISRFFDRSNINMRNAGISIQTGKGNAEVTDAKAKNSLFKISNGNLKLQEIYVDDLESILSHGNFEGRSLVPAGNWVIKNSHGNISLSLACNVSARLDAATRNGNIHSEIPLVRVTRQGPETYYGGRMVGTIGSTSEENLPELHIVNNHGNIDIDSHSPEREPVARPETAAHSPISEAQVKTEVQTPIPAGVAEKVGATEKPAVDTPKAILEALGQGKISVIEAEQLLKSMSL